MRLSSSRRRLDWLVARNWWRRDFETRYDGKCFIRLYSIANTRENPWSRAVERFIAVLSHGRETTRTTNTRHDTCKLAFMETIFQVEFALTVLRTTVVDSIMHQRSKRARMWLRANK
jgi:hypothetical protein